MNLFMGRPSSNSSSIEIDRKRVNFTNDRPHKSASQTLQLADCPVESNEACPHHQGHYRHVEAGSILNDHDYDNEQNQNRQPKSEIFHHLGQGIKRCHRRILWRWRQTSAAANWIADGNLVSLRRSHLYSRCMSLCPARDVTGESVKSPEGRE